MKTTKFLMVIMLAGLFTLTMNSCKKCKNEDPRARVVNNGTKVASVQIKTSEGNTEKSFPICVTFKKVLILTFVFL